MKRIQSLDGIRGIAGLLILVHHYIAGQLITQQKTVLAYLNISLSLTWSGVDLFFVLSGFLIAGILLDNQNASNYFQVFYLRRVCRIFPLYFLLLILFIISSRIVTLPTPAFDWLFSNPLPLWSYATFTQNIMMAISGDFGPRWIDVTWSLAIEEQFYFFIPLLIYKFKRRTLFYILLSLVLLAPLLRAGFPGFHAYVNTPWRADSLLSGACLAILTRSEYFNAMAIKYREYIYLLFVMFLAGAGLLTIRPKSFGELNHFWLAGLYTSFILLAVSHPEGWVSRILSNKILVWFGTLSYGIYMFHQAVSGLAHGFLRGQAPTIRSLEDAAITSLALLLTLGLAIVSYRWFEKPFLQLGQRYQYSPIQSVESVSADQNLVTGITNARNYFNDQRSLP